MRDTQRQRVYNAEREAFLDDLDTEKPSFPAVKDVERFVKKVWSSKRVQNTWPVALKNSAPRIEDGRGRQTACARGSCAVSLPTWARREWVILHELAHIITNRENSCLKEVAGHGWEFCEVYLKLVLYIMGREAHDTLKASFKKHRVRFRKPTKRAPLSPEHKAKLAAALARYAAA